MILNKIFNFFTKNQKKNFFYLIIFSSFVAFWEMLGIASILPYVALLSNPDLIQTNEILSSIYKLSKIIGVSNYNEFLYLCGIIFFLFLTTSIIFRVINNYMQTRFITMLEHSIGKSLVESYLHQPYAWFLNRNSANLGQNILSEVGVVVNGIIAPVLVIITSGIVFFAIITLLILINISVALSISLFFIASYLIIFYLVKKFLSHLGKERLQANQNRFRTLSETFGAIKEIKVCGLEQFHIHRFEIPSKKTATTAAFLTLVANLPRYLMEILTFGGLIFFILFLIHRDGEFKNIIPYISVYIFAGYRLLPLFQQLYGAFTQINFSNPSFHTLYKDLVNLGFKTTLSIVSPMPLKKSISLQNINFNYLNSKDKLIDDITMTIPAFSKVGIVGVSGSGKTTIVDLILGLLDPEQGTLKVDGNVITPDNKKFWQKSIGYVPQQIYLLDASIKENIAFGVEIQDIDLEAVKQAARAANLHDFIVKELPNGYDTTIGEKGIRISGGQRQRIGIARALYHNPQVLFLDEATNALDQNTEKAIIDGLCNLNNNKTIIIITHQISTIKKCDIIFLLENGKIKAQGNYEELIKNNKLFEKMCSAN
jgi:ABC-type multidrug transport system fused ATPase/permease subunit